MDRILTCSAYWLIAARHYTSMGSKGYAKLSQLSRIGYSPELASWRNAKGSDERNAAAELLRRKRREIRLTW